MLTPDNVQSVIGNNKIFSDTIQNFSTLPVRRVDCVAKVANSGIRSTRLPGSRTRRPILRRTSKS